MSQQFFKAGNTFHPAHPPHGMQDYDLGALEKDQIRKLNEMKMTIRRENEIYFNAHPEVKGLITILLRHILSKQPLIDIPEVMGTFFNRPRREIVADLLDYFSSVDKRPDVISNLRQKVIGEIIEATFDDNSNSQSDYDLHCCGHTEKNS